MMEHTCKALRLSYLAVILMVFRGIGKGMVMLCRVVYHY